MEFKRRRRMKRSEIDRLLSDEGTRNLLSGIKLINKSKILTRVVTRNNRVVNNTRPGIINSSNNNNNNPSSSTKSSASNKTKKIIKKSISLLGHSKIAQTMSNGTGGVRSARGANNNNNNNSNASKGTNGVSHSVKFHSSSSPPSQPLLATSLRGHVAFITLSYHNHSCVLKTQDLKDLQKKLEEYESRKGTSVIVFKSSSDMIFCDGLDVSELIHPDLTKRKNAIQRRIETIKNVLNTLSKSKKLLVASVNGGRVNGFGLILLGLFDLVFANDKATFSLQKYFQLKQPPEGISIFNESQLSTPTMKSFIYTGKTCTASEMYQNGILVTEVLWDSKYHEQLAMKLQNINSNESTKSIYKTYSSSKNTKQLNSEIAHEFSLLEPIWISDSWQKSAFQQLHRDS